MKTNNYLAILLGLFLFAGCPSTPQSSDTELSSHSPEELVKSAIQETGEFEFCLSEEADALTLRETVERLQKFVAALSESVSASALAESQKVKLNQSIEALKTACDGLLTSAESQAPAKKLSKENSKIRSQLISVSKALR